MAGPSVRLFFLAVFLPLFCAPSGAEQPLAGENAAQAQKWYTVAKAVSGDTVRLDSGAEVRYTSVRAPDLMSPSKDIENYAKESLEFNRSLAEGQQVRVEWGYRIRDRKGRYEGYIWREDGTLLNLEILKQGYAKLAIEPPNLEHAKELRDAAFSARREQKGLWHYEKDRPRNEVVYIGDNMKRQFHNPDCPLLEYVPQGHRRYYRAQVEATADGLRFCKTCKSSESQETSLF